MTELTQRVKVVHGVELPWRKLATGYDHMSDRTVVPGVTVLDEGVVFVPLSKLETLEEQGAWDSQFGSAFIDLNTHQGWACEQAGLAVRETRGGHHRGEKLTALLDQLHISYSEYSKGHPKP